MKSAVIVSFIRGCFGCIVMGMMHGFFQQRFGFMNYQLASMGNNPPFALQCCNCRFTTTHTVPIISPRVS